MTVDPSQRQSAARKVEVGGQVGAAVLGTGLGGAKLRDAYKEDHQAAFRAGQGHLYSTARKVGASRKTALKLTHIAGTGKPHFAQIAAGAGAAALATGAQRYQSYSKMKNRRAAVAKRVLTPTGANGWDGYSLDSHRTYDPPDLHRVADSIGPPTPAKVKAKRRKASAKQRAEAARDRRRAVMTKSGVSAFGVVHDVGKSQSAPGQHLPATQMGARALRTQAAVRHEDREYRKATRPTRPERGLHAVYANHGVQPGIEAAVAAKTRPSAVHPNIHYGTSVTPQLAAKLDRHLSPHASAALKHPVVFHRGETAPGALAAAAGAHTANGHRGHVILNEDVYDAHGKRVAGAGRTNVTFANTMNHELAHAAVKTQNPVGMGQRGAKAWLGEEGRADATSIPRKGLYRRQGAIMSPTKVRVAQKVLPHKEPLAPIHENLTAMRHYNDVHRKVRAARGQPHPGVARDVAEQVGHSLRSPSPKSVRRLVAVAAGATAGATVAAEHRATAQRAAQRRAQQQRRAQRNVTKSAFGVVHEIGKAGPLRRVLGLADTVTTNTAGHGFTERSSTRAGTWSHHPKQSYTRTEQHGRTTSTLKTKSEGGLTRRGKLASAGLSAAAGGGSVEEGRRTYLKRVKADYSAHDGY